MPVKVTNLFNYRNTCFIIGFVWCMAIGHVIPYFWRDTCYVAYDPVSWTWIFGDTPCGAIITTYTDYYTSVAIFVVMSTLDFCTFTMLVLYRRKAHLTSNTETKRRRHVEIRFFTQSCIQGVLFFYEVFMFNYVVTLNNNKWFVFITTTFAWELCHCLDGQYEYTDLTFGKILGQINILFWNACCYSHLVISLNRFLTICMPVKVTNLFNYRNTCFIIGFVWCMAIGHVIPYFWRDTCYVAYDPVSWTWIFGDTPCGAIITTYTDYYTSVAIFVVMSTLDFCTFTMLVLYRRKAHLTSNTETKRRRHVEIRFFTQSCIQGVLFFYEVFMFNYVVTLNNNKWFVFITTTFAWELCHCLDGQYEYTDLTFGKILGQINILFWNACCYSHLVISLNRFLTICMPVKVTNLFNYRNTCFIIGFVWCMAIGHVIPYFWRDTCYVAYDPVSWTWIFGDTPCGAIITTYTDYYTSVAIFVVMSTLDASTFTMLVLYRRKSHLTSDAETKRRRRVEIRFFTQSCIQGILFFYEVFNFYYIVTLNTNQWFVFMTSTFAWELCHCLDG
ncbi:hypothetical protein GCK72_016282 [Caenorhabditis remanei]|uniref:G-protein coupled receptors family 1 profile domain-containing protein n=1 Tax=Caenorhabditis remanei TaxID=31234 RepID=A0A6A5GZ08_CAERE|nr:hypothetical protein GCK72_016282 [Caenorhabditis remanei]KAF1759815.1 hypothetical protein GCK72_016282 [Caenorhabditis remanei]